MGQSGSVVATARRLLGMVLLRPCSWRATSHPASWLQRISPELGHACRRVSYATIARICRHARCSTVSSTTTGTTSRTSERRAGANAQTGKTFARDRLRSRAATEVHWPARAAGCGAHHCQSERAGARSRAASWRCRLPGQRQDAFRLRSHTDDRARVQAPLCRGGSDRRPDQDAGRARLCVGDRRARHLRHAGRHRSRYQARQADLLGARLRAVAERQFGQRTAEARPALH